jgi:hypothetical protein
MTGLQPQSYAALPERLSALCFVQATRFLMKSLMMADAAARTPQIG